MKLIGILDGTPLPVGYRLAFLTIFYREPLLRRIEREEGLIRPEWTVLVCLAYRDGLNARDICEITEQPSNTVSRGVATLLEKGLIRRAPDPEDARRSLLCLTEAGRAAYGRAMALFVEGEARMTACLDEAERATLIGLLDRMARAVPDWKTLPPYAEAPDT
ncbi:MAG: MarR family transcriptional regulator [Roseicyclus sp.]|jgi:DNA-binding MarR family transcriptional regulator|nr:MarR family transcriptional regulator [Roseicyclus sp.]